MRENTSTRTAFIPPGSSLCPPAAEWAAPRGAGLLEGSRVQPQACLCFHSTCRVMLRTSDAEFLICPRKYFPLNSCKCSSWSRKLSLCHHFQSLNRRRRQVNATSLKQIHTRRHPEVRVFIGSFSVAPTVPLGVSNLLHLPIL